MHAFCVHATLHDPGLQLAIADSHTGSGTDYNTHPHSPTRMHNYNAIHIYTRIRTQQYQHTHTHTHTRCAPHSSDCILTQLQSSLHELVHKPFTITVQIEFTRDPDGHPRLRVLDQLRLPFETVYVDVRGVDDAWEVVRSMRVRGAPVSACVCMFHYTSCIIALTACLHTANSFTSMTYSICQSLMISLARSTLTQKIQSDTSCTFLSYTA